MILTLQSLLYAAIVFLIFSNIRPVYRIYLLAVASFGYIFFLDSDAAFVALGVSVYAYVFGILTGVLIDKENRRTAGIVCAVSIVLCIMALLILKYSGLLHLPDSLIIPLGFSFYIFQVISYFSDIYTGKTSAEKNPVKMIVYLMWFPKFVSGPIERKTFFDVQMKKVAEVRLKDPDRWVRVAHYLLTGFFYKLVIADRLGILVDSIYAHYSEYDAFWLLAGMIMYTLQIYFDFAGYSYAAIGFSLVFGIDLSENFRMPYLSSNITEFWRRWHISLSSWLKDYIYIPLGGNRKGNFRKIINTLIVFILCGIWHGESISFVVWGLLHGIFSAVDSMAAQKGITRIREGMTGRLITFISVAFAWIFFRAQTMGEALGYIAGMLTPGRWFKTILEDRRSMGLEIHDAVLILITLAIALFVEIKAYREDATVPGVVIKRNYPIRYIVVFAAVIAIILFGVYGPDTADRLIYMQF